MICRVDPSIIPFLHVLVHDGKTSNALNYCWIPGLVISKSAYEFNFIASSHQFNFDVFISEGS